MGFFPASDWRYFGSRFECKYGRYRHRRLSCHLYHQRGRRCHRWELRWWKGGWNQSGRAGRCLYPYDLHRRQDPTSLCWEGVQCRGRQDCFPLHKGPVASAASVQGPLHCPLGRVSWPGGPDPLRRARALGERKKRPRHPGVKEEKEGGGEPLDLREKLRKLRERIAGGGKEEVINLLSGSEEHEDGDELNSEDWETGLRTGSGLTPQTTVLALRDRAEVEGTRDGMVKKERGRKRVKKIKKEERLKSRPSSALLAAAEQVEERKKQERRKKKSKKSKGGREVKALVDLLKGKKKKSRGKKDPSSSGDSSSSSDEDSDQDEESDSSEMLAPLQKRSSRKPGTVLKMLVKHARSTLDQSSAVDVDQKGSLTSGIRMATYFNLMIRPYHSSGSRDMKELHYLSIAMDELRQGLLGKLGAPCFPLSGGACSSQRGHVEKCSVSGITPLGSYPIGSNAGIIGGQEAFPSYQQEPQQRRGSLEETSLSRRLEEPKLGDRRREGKRQRRKRKRWERPRKRSWLLGKRIRARMAKRWAVQLVGSATRDEREQRRKGWKGCRKEGEVKPVEETNTTEEVDAFRWKSGFEDMNRLAADGRSLSLVGCILAWMVIHADIDLKKDGGMRPIWWLLRGVNAGHSAVHQSPGKREAFPIPLGGLSSFVQAAGKCSYEMAIAESFVARWSHDAWLFCSLQYCNYMHGSRALPEGCWRTIHRKAIGVLRGGIERILSTDTFADTTAEDVEKELSHRFVSYTGEEVPKMEVLSWDQVVPSLPPASHGGSIPVLDWLDGRPKVFGSTPAHCVEEDVGQKLPKLQSKVHICRGDERKLALTLVERGICSWTLEEDVFKYRGQKVLNGLFGVCKPSTIPDGRPVLRLIMNLIPSNSVMVQLQGRVGDLPGITQYLSVVLEDGESLSISQADMTSAFYLFKLPDEWSPYLCFNLCFKGREIGFDDHAIRYLSCAVLPMGWSNAVSVMQEISEQLLLTQGLPRSMQVARTKPLPQWLTLSLSHAESSGLAWWHVYLDNFMSGEKVPTGQAGREEQRLHQLAELSWRRAGVLSSEKKRVVSAPAVEELHGRLVGWEQCKFGGDG